MDPARMICPRGERCKNANASERGAGVKDAAQFGNHNRGVARSVIELPTVTC